MKRVLLQRHLPRWVEHRRLPLMAVFLPAEKTLVRDKPGAVRITKKPPSTHGLKDGKWALYNGHLFAASFAEDVPPLSFRKKVPPGEYMVLIDLYSESSYGGYPASSLAIKLKGQTDWQTVTRMPEPGEAAGFVWAEAGSCSLADGIFEAAVAPGEPTHWAGFKGFVLLSPTEEARAGFERLMRGRVESQDESAARIERLRALGYLQ